MHSNSMRSQGGKNTEVRGSGDICKASCRAGWGRSGGWWLTSALDASRAMALVPSLTALPYSWSSQYTVERRMAASKLLASICMAIPYEREACCSSPFACARNQNAWGEATVRPRANPRSAAQGRDAGPPPPGLAGSILPTVERRGERKEQDFSACTGRGGHHWERLRVRQGRRSPASCPPPLHARDVASITRRGEDRG